MKYKIAVLDNINLLPEGEEQLQVFANKQLAFPKNNKASEKELIHRTGNAEAVLVSIEASITESYLSACPSVKYIGLCGTSTANIDLDALMKRQIVLKNVVDYGDEPAAEYMIMLLIQLARGEDVYMWKKMPTELMGKTIGIIGLGALGKTAARLALGFKMKVTYYSLHRKPEWEKQGVLYQNKNVLLQKSDVIAITTPTNVKVLDKNRFELIKANSVLLYLSSGEAFDKQVFIDWISKKENFAIFNYSAGDDFYRAFKDLSNVIFPKVIAGYTRETKERLGQKVINNLKAYFNAHET
jgi:phosphoglycerate dehydrogenase-like enzyme